MKKKSKPPKSQVASLHDIAKILEKNREIPLKGYGFRHEIEPPIITIDIENIYGFRNGHSIILFDEYKSDEELIEEAKKQLEEILIKELNNKKDRGKFKKRLGKILKKQREINLALATG